MLEHQYMNFPDALHQVIKGYVVTKEEWNNSAIYVWLDDEYLTIKKADGTNHPILLRAADLHGEDWRIVATLEGYIED